MNNLVRSFPWSILLAFYIASGGAADLSTPESGESPLLKQPPTDAPARVDGLSKKELNAFVDGVLFSALGDHKIAGATVAVVTRDEIMHLQGYGYANAPKRLKVDATEHLFRIASITKTFTATAVMQLVEAGKLELDSDIKTYLPEMRIDDHLGTITVAHLLSHTPGFEDRFLAYYGPPMEGEGEALAEQLASLGAYQVRPPGEIVSYSNFGFTLLGEIIARVSGQSYADYLREHILDPLQMTSSDVRVKTTPDPPGTEWLAALRAREAKAHRWSQGWYEVTDFPLSRSTVQAEGTMSATAADMANYMQMHLNRGRWNDEVILQEGTWAKMSELLFTHDVALAGNAHGFWTDEYAGYRVLQHGGSINDFKSMLALIPELGLGVFVSGNTDSSSELSDLPRLLVEQWSRATAVQRSAQRSVEGFVRSPAQSPAHDPLRSSFRNPSQTLLQPTEEVSMEDGESLVNASALPVPSFHPPEPVADFPSRADLYTGHYLSSRRNEKRYDRLLYTLSGGMDVSATSTGYLVLSRGQNSSRYVEAAGGNHQFVSVDDGRKIQFRIIDDEVAWLFTPGSGAYEPAAFFEKPGSFLVPLVAALVGAVGCLLAGIWGAGKRWQLSRKRRYWHKQDETTVQDAIAQETNTREAISRESGGPVSLAVWVAMGASLLWLLSF
ncbi:MAG: serine hydrolase domain-containing protein, partial [Pseudomonadota bacterium]